VTRTVPVVVTHLEMLAPPAAASVSQPSGVTLERIGPPEAAAAAARMYHLVGAPWQWRDRLPWDAAEWEAAIHANGVEVWVARRCDEELGYVELAPSGDAMEIRYFGLVPTAMGQGIGRWLLQRALEIAWASAPTRVILNTCTLDGPAALPNYLARGFTVVREDHQLRELPT
jgi:GNAT superfamily N-acetyltransferase